MDPEPLRKHVSRGHSLSLLFYLQVGSPVDVRTLTEQALGSHDGSTHDDTGAAPQVLVTVT